MALAPGADFLRSVPSGVAILFRTLVVIEPGCFRSLLLVTCPHLLLRQALVPNLGAARVSWRQIRL